MKKLLFSYFMLNRTSILVLALFSTVLISHFQPKNIRGDKQTWSIYQGDHVYTYIQPHNPLLNIWSVWDTKWYVSIAEDGYSTQKYPFTKIDNKGFLPVYPILLYIVGNGLFFGNIHIAGIVVSNLFLILSLFFLILLVRSESKLKDVVNEKELFLYTLLFPTSYYLSAIYPESLFLLLSILIFYCVQKEKIFLACLLFSIACLTKTFGIFLCIPIIYFTITKRHTISFTKLLGYIVTLMVLPILYCIHMYVISGDPFAYIHIQQGFFRHTWIEPFTLIITKIITLNPYSLWTTSFIVFGLAALVTSYRKIPYTYTLYGICYILFTPFTGVLEGSSRYMASLFILPIALATSVRREDVRNMIYISFAMIQGFSIFWWVAGAGFTS